MIGRLVDRVLAWIDASLAAIGYGFLRAWTKVERSYRRPFSRVALVLKFSFYPLLAMGAIIWLAWDWGHERSLNSAENAIFDRVVQWRPFEPRPSGRVVVVEIDECSIEYFRARGEGGWPWSRQRHADLLDQLDRAGVRAVGYDVLFTDRSSSDPVGDHSLEAMVKGGAGRFVFGSTRLHPDYDEGSPLRASQAPAAFALIARPRNDPKVALLLPYGDEMARFSALANVNRGEDGVLRDIPLRETVGDWALPSLPLRLAMVATGRSPSEFAAAARPNWRRDTRLPRISAADLLTGPKPICRDATIPPPDLRDRVALVGYTAAGVNDAKPTPVDPVMPGVEVMAEATEALIAGSGIRAPPAWLKYAIAMLFTALTTFVFYRGEPADDIDSIFVATNLMLLAAAFVGLTFFGFFFDIFASVASSAWSSAFAGSTPAFNAVARSAMAISCRSSIREGSLVRIARLRFVPDVGHRERPLRNTARIPPPPAAFPVCRQRCGDARGCRGTEELAARCPDDLMVLIWHGESEDAARSAAMHDLARLERELAEYDAPPAGRRHRQDCVRLRGD